MSIGPAVAAARPMRPDPGEGGTTTALPWHHAVTKTASEAEQAAADPPQAPGPDGWSPATITPVMSKNGDGFLMSMLHFTTGGVEEQPGQRLSTAQIDQLAPFYAAEFHVDEDWVRHNLAQVYVYYGGPASPQGGAMTVGHHIFVPARTDVQRILSPDGKRWLAHELTHTMQFAVYDGSNGHSFLSSYIKSMAIGYDPVTGTGSGPKVWGAAFTGWRTNQQGYRSLGRPSATLADRLGFSLAPAALIGIPVGLVAGGTLGAARNAFERGAPQLEKSVNLLGHGGALRTGLGLVSAPMIAGALVGVYGDKLGEQRSRWLGAAAGAATAGATLLWAGAFARTGSTLGGWAGRIGALGAIGAAGLLGFATASISSNTIKGFTANGQKLNAILQRDGDRPDLMGAVHDSHWIEIEAETSAQDFVHHTLGDHPDASQWKGVVPSHPDEIGNRVDWGLWNPLIIGVPLAAAAGAAVMGTRTGITLLDQTVRQGHGPMEAIGAAIAQLRSHGRGVGNSLGVGAALTVAPLIAGGVAGPIASVNLGLGDMTSRLVGAGTAAVTGGVLLTMLLGGRGNSLLRTSPKILAGMGIAGAVGFAAASVAIDAMKPGERTYDVTKGTHAIATK